MSLDKKEFLNHVCWEYGGEEDFFNENFENIVCFRDSKKSPYYFSKVNILDMSILDCLQNYVDIPVDVVNLINSAGYDYVMGEYLGGNFYTVDRKTSFGGEYIFLDCHGYIYATSSEAAAEFKKKYEEHVFPKYDESKVNFTVIDGKELNHHIMYERHDSLVNELYYHTEGGGHSYIGMNYFLSNYEHLSEKQRFLLAVIDGRVVGVICYGFWGDGPLSMSYINVSGPYRGKGIATSLVQKFAEVVANEKEITLTRESEMGQQCHMHDLFKKYLTIPVRVDKW